LKSPTIDILFRICDALGVAASVIIHAVEASGKDKNKEGLIARCAAIAVSWILQGAISLPSTKTL